MQKFTNLKKYIDYSWHTEYPAIREVLHAKILSDHFLNKPQVKSPTIIFTGGCYGAGKGHTMRYLHSIGKINLNDWVYADPDKIRTNFPEYEKLVTEQGNKMGDITSKEAGYLVELVEYYALENGYNIIIDGSLKDYEWHISHFSMIRTNFKSFQIIVIFVMANLDTIIKRSHKRCEETLRCVPIQTIEQTFTKIDVAYEEYKKIIPKCYKVRNFSQGHDEFFLEDIQKINI